MSLSSHGVWLALLFASNGLSLLAMNVVMWHWRRRYAQVLHGTWSAEASLLPEVLPDVKVSKTGEVLFTIRVINRGPCRWFLKEIDWTTATFELGGVASVSQPTPRSTVSNTIAPWALWKQAYSAAAAITLDTAALSAVRVTFLAGVTLWVVSERSAEAFPVRLGPQTVYAPVHPC